MLLRFLGLTAVVLTLLAGPPMAAALDCRGMTPLPEDLRVVPPASEIPEAPARFAGAWAGVWRDARGDGCSATPSSSRRC